MPLIVICSIPCSGKTTLARNLKEFFEQKHDKLVEIISEESTINKLGYEKNSFYLDSQKEKRVREHLKSEVIRLVRKDNVIILDGSNYIKGYRYELYCATKSIQTTQCTVYPVLNIDDAWKNNELRKQTLENGTNTSSDIAAMSIPYSKEVFDALVLRFEEPKGKDRWDSPLFMYLPNEYPPLDDIFKALFETAPPPPNMSTQNAPLSSTNFLYQLDTVTQEITKRITDAKNLNPSSELRFKEYPDCVLEAEFMAQADSRKLLKLRRQFLIYAKMQYSNVDSEKIGRYFIQYLNKTLQE